MLYSPPTGSNDPNAPYVGKNVQAGQQGSKVPPAAIEFTQREIVNTITASGQTPTNTDPQQLLKAIRGGTLNYFRDGGAVNQIVVAPSPIYLALVEGNSFRVKMAFAPTGPATLAVNNLVAVPIRKSGNNALSGGEWAAGDIVTLVYDGFYFQFVGAQGASSLIVTANLTLNVPSQYSSIRAAVLAASLMIIAPNVYVTIQVAAGYVENLSTATGPIDLRTPFGNNIRIVGPALSGAFPSAAEILAAGSKANVLTLLKSRFNVVVNAVAVDGFQIHSGGLNLLSGVLIVCDGTPGCFAVRVGDWQTDIGVGFLGVRTVWVHGAGQNGFDAQFQGAVRAQDLGSTYNTADGIRAAHGCHIECNFGNLLSMFNGGNGGYGANSGQISVDSSSGTMDFAYNTKSGLYCAQTGKANLLPATGVRLNNNGRYAVEGYGQSQINLPPTVTYGGNGLGDLYAYLATVITASGSSPGTCSPAKNTLSGDGSRIVV